MMSLSALFTLYCLLTTAPNLNPPEVQALLQSGLAFAYVEEFDSAAVYFDELIERYPQNPSGYFFKAALLQVKMLDRSDYRAEEEYLSLMRTAIHRSEDILEHENNLWAEFYLGSGYTYRAVHEGLKGNYWETFKYGVKGGRILQNIIKKDSTFYDAYLGLGSYHYWASVTTKALRWLPFFRDERKRGIEEVKLSAEKSLYSKESALYGLIYIYLEEKEYDQAIRLSREMNQQFPESKLFLWPLAEALYLKKEWMNSIACYQQILKLIQNPDPSGYFNTIECRHRMAESYLHLKMYDKCKEECEKILKYPLSPLSSLLGSPDDVPSVINPSFSRLPLLARQCIKKHLYITPKSNLCQATDLPSCVFCVKVKEERLKRHGGKDLNR